MSDIVGQAYALQVCGIELIIGIVLLIGYFVWQWRQDKRKR